MQLQETNLIVRRDDLIADLKLAILDVTDVEHIAIVNLDVRDFELGDAVDNDATRVVLLATRLCIEARAVKEEAKG